jgi:hypothetical protein
MGQGGTEKETGGGGEGNEFDIFMSFLQCRSSGNCHFPNIY